jgi:hypothetical protein
MATAVLPVRVLSMASNRARCNRPQYSDCEAYTKLTRLHAALHKKSDRCGINYSFLNWIELRKSLKSLVPRPDSMYAMNVERFSHFMSEGNRKGPQ